MSSSSHRKQAGELRDANNPTGHKTSADQQFVAINNLTENLAYKAVNRDQGKESSYEVVDL